MLTDQNHSSIFKVKGAISAPFILSLIAILIWSWIDPHERGTWWMEAMPVLAGAPLLFFTRKKFPLTTMLYIALWFHAVILLVGAHYTYARVPLFDWLRDYYDLSRNHYDRLGHFVQGAVPALIAHELLVRTSPLKSGKWLYVAILLACLGISAIYEIIEWIAAVVTKDGAESFLGSQGDVWDSQKDMMWAGIGALFSEAFLFRWHKRQLDKV